MIHQSHHTLVKPKSISHQFMFGAVSMRMLTKIMNKEELEEKEIILNHVLNCVVHTCVIIKLALGLIF